MNDELLYETTPEYRFFLRVIADFDLATALSMFPVTMSPLLLFSPELRRWISNNLPGSQDGTIFVFVMSMYIISILLILPILAYFDKKNFEVTKYKVYSDRVEFEQGFINYAYKTLKLADVKEIHLSQNFFQKKAGLGTISFLTAANLENTNTQRGRYRNVSRAISKLNGFYFKDIKNPLAVYTKLKQLQENLNNDEY